MEPDAMAFVLLDQAALELLTSIFEEDAKRMRQRADHVHRLSEEIRARLADKEPDGTWQPAGLYPIDGTIIEVEDRGRMRFTNYRANERDRHLQLGGWTIDHVAGWVPSPPPTTRWRKAPPVEA